MNRRILFALLLASLAPACDADTQTAASDAAPDSGQTTPADTVTPSTPGDTAISEVDGTSSVDTTGDTTDDRPRTNLVSVEGWQAADPEADPFSAFRPDPLECPDDAWGDESGVLEIRTESCPYVTVSQPLLAGLVAGDAFEITAWHGQLASFDVAMGTIAVTIGEAIVWQEDVPIPNPGAFFVVPLEATQDAPVGTLVRFHVHNHGFNSWNLASIQKL